MAVFLPLMLGPVVATTMSTIWSFRVGALISIFDLVFIVMMPESLNFQEKEIEPLIVATNIDGWVFCWWCYWW